MSTTGVAAFHKFEHFALDLCKGVHALDGDEHVLKVYLCDTVPDAAAHQVKDDLSEIDQVDGYAGPVDVTNTLTIDDGVVSCMGESVTITSSGIVGPFQYVVLYNDTPTSPADPLIGWWELPAARILLAGSSFTLDLTGSPMFTVR